METSFKYYLRTYFTQEEGQELSTCLIRINERVPKSIPQDWFKQLSLLIYKKCPDIPLIMYEDLERAFSNELLKLHRFSDYIIKVTIQPPIALPNYPIDTAHYVVLVYESPEHRKRVLENHFNQMKKLREAIGN